MTWTCSKCATRHETEDERRACRRAGRALAAITVGILVALAVVSLGAKIAWSSDAYGDWKCAFMECRKVVK